MTDTINAAASQPNAGAQPVNAPVVGARRPSRDRRLWALVWSRLRQDAVALVAASLLIALVLVVIAAPITAPRDPIRQESSMRLSPPLTPGPTGVPSAFGGCSAQLVAGGSGQCLVGPGRHSALPD